MKPGEVRLEDLLGRVVRNDFDRPIGRIEDLRVEPEGEEYVVTEFILGPLDLAPRLLDFFGQLPTVRALGIGRRIHHRPIPWHWMDLTDPAHPRLRGEGRR